jgi:MFS family permease
VKQSKVVCTEDDYKKRTGDKCAHDYCDRETNAAKTAATIFSIPYFMSATLSPFMGGAVDLIGGRAIICFASAATLIGVHSLLAFTDITPVVPMVGQGLAYSMFASALWPSVPYLVPERSVGIAYGVVTAVQNAGLAGIPLLVSAVYDIDDAYIPKVEIIFIVFAVAGSICAIALNFMAPQLNWKRPSRCPDPDEPEDGNTYPSLPPSKDGLGKAYNVLRDDTF